MLGPLFRRLLGRKPPPATAAGEGDAPPAHRDDDAPMKVILGLGNPGREYERTRHNVGWVVLDHLADVWRLDGAWRKDGEALTLTGTLGAEKVRLLKPLTFMNLSGQVLRPYLRRPFWSAKQDLLLVVDEVALELGRFRLRARGSAGGHNGLKSVEHYLKSQEYCRLRIGIGPHDPRRRSGDLADFVLDPFGRDEEEEVRALLPRVTEAVETWAREGTSRAANRFNAFELRPADDDRLAAPGEIDGPPDERGIRRTRTGWRRTRHIDDEEAPDAIGRSGR